MMTMFILRQTNPLRLIWILITDHKLDGESVRNLDFSSKLVAQTHGRSCAVWFLKVGVLIALKRDKKPSIFTY